MEEVPQRNFADISPIDTFSPISFHLKGTQA
jgi:hypothetical protein